MRRGQRLIVQPELLEDARPEVLDHDVSLGDQAVEQAPPFRGLEIERDAFLVAVDAQEVHAFPVDERRTPGARVVALVRLLDLDDARPHVREEHRAVRPGQYAGQVEHRDAVERRCVAATHGSPGNFSHTPRDCAPRRTDDSPCIQLSAIEYAYLHRMYNTPHAEG